MSSTIEFNRHVIVSKPVGRPENPLYFGFCEYGSSNVITRRNTIARNNCLLLVEPEHRFMQEIIKKSVFCEGGMLKMNGRKVKPESYIATWRQAQKTALPLRYYLEQTNMDIEFRSMVEQLQEKQRELDLSKDWNQKSHQTINDIINELCMSEGVNETTRSFYGSNVSVTQFCITEKNVDRLLNLLSRLMQAGVSGQSIWKSDFNEHAWAKAQNASFMDECKPVSHVG